MRHASERAAAWGVLPGYRDVERRWHPTPPATAAALVEAMGGAARPVPDLPPPAQGAEALCELPAGLRAWGWAAQLYAARSASSWGIGDLADLRRLGAWSRRQGARYLFLNPLHAPRPVLPLEPSPYYPSSRRFRNPIYIRVEEVPGWEQLAASLEPLAREGRELNRSRLIDRDRVWALKMAALEALFTQFQGCAEFDVYVSEMGRSLEHYARFCALTEVHAGPWQQWPARHRRPGSPGVESFARQRSHRVRFHAWLQWLLDRQLAAAGAENGLVADLAIGVDPSGADAWADQDLLLGGFTVGAPPDAFNTQGQNWQQATFDPGRLAEAGFEPFRAMIAAGLRHAAGLRIDHVMGLWRLFLIPAGGSPLDGAYVSYPHQHLLDVVARESRRARALVVGEDLGTVPAEVRRELLRRRMLGYRLVWFEHRAPARYPARSLAALTTHDLPTLAGIWSGLDGPPLLKRRLLRYFGLRPDLPLSDVIAAVYERLAAAPSMLVAASLEDGLELVERPNRPGTVAGRFPNWSLALPLTLEQIERDPRPARLAATMSDRNG